MERTAVLLVGCLPDFLFGDPLWMPHPVVAMGKGISILKKFLRRVFPASPRGELAAGVVLAVQLPLLSFLIAFALLWLAGLVHPLLRFALECFFCYQILASRRLWRAGLDVYRELAAGDLPAARRAVGRVVGRQTENLSEAEVTRATVETLAENTSDGIVAPLLFLLLGGAPLALAYKAVNTMDSVVGYKNERHLYFSRAAARLDDVANFIPVRLTALLMAAGCRVYGSRANYLFFRAAPGLGEALAQRGILVRDCTNYAGLGPGWYRASVRLRPENEQLADAVAAAAR